MTPEEHEAAAKDSNRETWALLQRDDRGVDDDERMVHAAHASAFHWQVTGGPIESTRADWLVSHVYAVLGQSEPAIEYARRSLATCEANGIGDFNLAYAYEGMARGAAAGGDAGETRRWRVRAEPAALAIVDDEDRDLFLADLTAEPWFGT